MRIFQLYFFIALFFCVHTSDAQSFESQIRHAVHQKPKFDFHLDSRGAFINQSSVRVFGFKLGLEYDHKLTFGLGYNQLISKVKNKIVDKGMERDVQLKYFYFSPFISYIFYRDEKWELSIPVQFGFGSSSYQFNLENMKVNIFKAFVLSYEPAITFQYRFLRYFGAGAGVGYRLMIVPNKKIEEQFTSPVYLFKFKVYFQDLYQDVFNK